MTDPDVFVRARTLIDAVHALDPELDQDAPAELRYADRVEDWLIRLHPDADPLLRLAARCQHLERWAVPRASFPQDRAGYLRWRTSLYHRQADRARALLIEAGVSVEAADQARAWIAKTDLRGNSGSQALEDAACLVFLEFELADFAAGKAHDEAYSEAKWLDIIRKTWRKMSSAAQTAALTIPLAEPLRALVVKAVSTPG